MAPRDYARLHFDWYRDEVLEAIADEEPAALWIWPVLIAIAKEESHATTNPTGAFERSAAGIAKASHVPLAQVQHALELLVEGEFLTTSPGSKPRVLRIELEGFAKWQTPRKGKAEQEQKRRDASRENVEPRGGSVGGALPSVTETGDVEKVSGSLRSPSSVAGGDDQLEVAGCAHSTSSVPCSNCAADAVERAGKVSSRMVAGVFEAWAELFHRNGNTKLDQRRRRRIEWALREYGREDVWRCLKGYASDPWRHEKATHNEIATLFRNAGTFEAGLQMHGDHRPPSGGDDIENLGY